MKKLIMAAGINGNRISITSSKRKWKKTETIPMIKAHPARTAMKENNIRAGIV
jgi:hypothetical protein